MGKEKQKQNQQQKQQNQQDYERAAYLMFQAVPRLGDLADKKCKGDGFHACFTLATAAAERCVSEEYARKWFLELAGSVFDLVRLLHSRASKKRRAEADQGAA